MCTHFQHEDRQGENGRNQSAPANGLGFLCLSLGARGAGIRRCGFGDIAGVSHRSREVTRSDGPFEIAHPGGFRSEVDRSGQHARHGRERLFHPPDGRRRRTSTTRSA